MHIYEVVPRDHADLFKEIENSIGSIVIAKSPENAVKLAVDHYNADHYNVDFYLTSDFEAMSPIDPNDYDEETLIN